MANTNDAPPIPVEGIVFGRSVAKTFGFIVLSVFLFLFGVFLIWAKVTDQVLDRGPDAKHVTWWGLLIGIGAVLGAPIIIVLLLRSLWVKRRLVVGSDRLQMVEHIGSQDTVVLQIPYANVAEVKYEATSTERRVGIDLRDLGDPETYARSESFPVNKQFQGRHFCISGGYRGGPHAIATAIERAYEKWGGK